MRKAIAPKVTQFRNNAELTYPIVQNAKAAASNKRPMPKYLKTGSCLLRNFPPRSPAAKTLLTKNKTTRVFIRDKMIL